MNEPWRQRLGAARLYAITPRPGFRAWPYYGAAVFAVVTVQSPTSPGLTLDRSWRLHVRPKWVEEHTVAEIADRLVHLITHLLRLHPERSGNFTTTRETGLRWVLATDIEINDDLLRDGHRFVERRPSDFQLPDGETAEWYYRRLRDDKVRVDQTDCGSAAGGGLRPWEDVGSPGLSPAAGDLVRWEVARDILNHKSAGTLPAGLQRWAEEVLQPKVDWRIALGAATRHTLRHQAGMVDYSYSRPSRRSGADPRFMQPTMVSPAPSVAVVLDTSGSMAGDHLGQCLGEVQGILTKVGCHRSAIRVICCDAISYGVAEITSARLLPLVGGGGTDMGIGIASAVELRPRPDLIVVLTDGHTPWPDRPPRVPVIVGLLDMPPAPPTPPSWATVVRVPVDERSSGS